MLLTYVTSSGRRCAHHHTVGLCDAQTHFDERSLPVSGRRCEWVANTTVATDDFGWAEPSGDGPLHNFRYFMRRADIAAFQRSVLGREFERGPPGDGQRVRGLTTTTTFKQHQ